MSKKTDSIVFTLNGQRVSSSSPLYTRVSDVLRAEFQQHDVKVGCNAGDCGACTVLVDGQAVCACLMSLSSINGKHVESVRGLMQSDNVTQSLAESFVAHGAVQCGICTPGMLVAATPLLRQNASPSEQQVKDALGGVLCRCTGYRKIIDAVVNVGSAEATAGASRQHLDSSVEPLQPVLAGNVGDAIRRIDGNKKAFADDQFGDDIAPKDALHMHIVRSPFHYADFTFGDIASFIKKHPGIVRVFTAADIPGLNIHGVIPDFADQPVFAQNTARFKGEAVAAFVGANKLAIEKAIDDFPINYTELEPILTTTQAMQDDAPTLHNNRAGNVMCHGFVQRGNAAEVIHTSDVQVSARFRTSFVEHAYIEPEAGYAVRVGNRIEIYGCTQAPYMNKESLAQILGIAADDVRIVPSATGGGFGSKLDISYQAFVAVAAWHLDKPVRITYSRRESMQSTTKRHPADMQVQLSANRDGKVQAMHFKGIFNTGAYASWGPTVSNRVPVHASGPYYIPHYYAKATAIHTHSVPAGAFRGFGVPQAAVAQECLFDELANDLGHDRLAFRINNALRNNQSTVTGQRFESSVGIGACLEALSTPWRTAIEKADKLNKAAVSREDPVRYGVGIASAWYGCGNTSLPNPSIIKAGIKPDGRLCLHQGAVDIGQGSNTVISQIFATAFGIDIAQVTIESADTDITPDAGKTSASRQTFVSGNAAKLAGLQLREQVLRLTNSSEQSAITFEGNSIVINDGADTLRRIELNTMPCDADGYVLSAAGEYDPPTQPLDENGQGVPYAIFGYAAQMVELSVDTELGTVVLQAITAAHDVGKAINPDLVEGQIQGGLAQGIGMALMESFTPNSADNLHDYLIPTIGDVPPIKSIIIEVSDPHGPYGAKGLGEHVLIPTAPSILNAIAHASGARLYELPATPDRIMQAINSRRVGAN